MEDIVTRAGRNLDIVFFTIAATLIFPPLAVLGALLSSLYGSGKPKDKRYDYSELKNIIYKAIIQHNYRVRNRLIEYGIKKPDADILVHQPAYEDYIDRLVTTYT